MLAATTLTGVKGFMYSRLLIAIATILFSTISFAASAAPQENYDALAEAPVIGGSSIDGVQAGGLSGFRGQMEPRLGLPTFLFAPDSQVKRSGPLKASTDETSVARAYLRDVAPMYQISTTGVDELKLIDTQRLKNGAALVRFANEISGIEVFRDRVSVLVNADGGLNSIGGFVSGSGSRNVDTTAATSFVLTPEQMLEVMLQQVDILIEEQEWAGIQTALAQGNYNEYTVPKVQGQSRYLVEPARIKPVWFRLPSGLIPAYYGEVQLTDVSDNSEEAWSFVISAQNSKVLFRKSLIEYDTAFNYRVFAETTPPYRPMVGPQGRGGYPHPTATPDNFQPPFVAPLLVSLVSAPFSMADPWLPDGATETVGNNVDAYADLAGGDGYHPLNGDVRAALSAATSFDYTYNTGSAPQANSTQIQASITHLFFLNNWLHDWFYDSGFDEAAGNAQDDNFGRGGLGADSLKAETANNPETDNANMSTPADGGRPRMQMYVFVGVGAAKLTVDGPSLDQEFDSGTASFGPQAFDVSGAIILGNDGTLTPTFGCSPIVNDVSGRIVLLDRGNCTFASKAANAQAAGALAVLIANNAVAAAPPNLGGTDPSIIIPAGSVTQAVGGDIKAQLLLGAVNGHLVREAAVDRDSAIDNAIVIHEWGHFISNRLVMNSSGLTSNQSRGMGEGWGDFHALLALVQEDDALVPSNPDFSGVYAEGGYATGASSKNSHYYGIRRYPYSTDMSKNPLTFKHIENGVALPVSPPPAFSGSPNAQVHNTGEVWGSALWECYVNLINDEGRLTFDEAQQRMKDYLVAGYKMTPADPTFVEARDALLSVMASQDVDDYVACATGFAKRGIGPGAVAPDRYDPNNSGVVESFATGPAPYVSIDAIGDSVYSCDADSILDNGETGRLELTVRNVGLETMSGANLTLSSPQPGLVFSPAAINNIDLPPGQETVVQVDVSFTGIVGIGSLQVDAELDHPGSGQSSDASRQFRVNADEMADASKTETFEAMSLTWATSSETTTAQWQLRQETHLDHRAHGVDVSEIGVQWLVSPALQVSPAVSFTVAFNALHSFEFDGTAWDGGVVELSEDGGANWTDIGIQLTPVYNGTITDLSDNPLVNRSAYVAENASWPALDSYSADFGLSFASKTVLIRFGVGTDSFAGDHGWEIDDITIGGILNNPFTAVVAESEVCTFDPGRIFEDGFE
jgi:hypothetical protein